MVRRIKKVVKNKPTRKRKKLIVVGTEGDNKSEMMYLRNIERRQDEYHFIFDQGNETDPVKIVKNTDKRARQEEISPQKGDMAVSIFDLDLDNAKAPQLVEAKALADRKNIKILSSNPCFELWYLEHFKYTTKPFISSSALVQELKKYIPGYTKNSCDFDSLYPKTEKAIVNCQKLDNHHKKNGTAGLSEFNNPRTDFYKLIEIIIDKKGSD